MKSATITPEKTITKIGEVFNRNREVTSITISRPQMINITQNEIWIATLTRGMLYKQVQKNLEAMETSRFIVVDQMYRRLTHLIKLSPQVAKLAHRVYNKTNLL